MSEREKADKNNQCTWVEDGERCKNEATGEDYAEDIMNLCQEHANELDESLNALFE